MERIEESRIRRIEALIAKMEAIPDADIRADFSELMEAVLEWHGRGLQRAIEIVQAIGEPGRLAVSHLAAEPLISSLLVLHGVHPDDLKTRVRKAVGRIRGASLLGIEEGVVRVRVGGDSATEAALGILREAAPDAADISIEEVPAQGSFVPLSSLVPSLSRET